MIGTTTSAKPDCSSVVTTRASMRLRRAVSSTSSALAPVGYRNAIKPKTSSPLLEEEAFDSHALAHRAPPPSRRGTDERTPTDRGDGGGAGGYAVSCGGGV